MSKIEQTRQQQYNTTIRCRENDDIHVEESPFMELQKYGEILLSENGDEFILCCTLCAEIFFEYSQFIEHAKLKHNVAVNKTDQDQEYDGSDGGDWNSPAWDSTWCSNSCPEEPSPIFDPSSVVPESLQDFDDLAECIEEIGWNTADSDYQSGETIEPTTAGVPADYTQVATNDYSIEYLIEECLDLDEMTLQTDDNGNKTENIVKPEKVRKQKHASDESKPLSNSSNALIRNKRLLWYFIELYKEHPCLWRADHEHINDREKRLHAVEQIANTMHRRFLFQISTSKAIKTIKNMRACYLREYHRKSQDPKYTPKLWYYNKLSFIEDATSYDYRQNGERTLESIIEPPTTKCDNCKKEFKTNKSLRHHLNTHSECKPFQCFQCDKTFRSPANLQAHMASHVPMSERRYTCEFCGLKIALQHNYLVHLRRHTKQFAHHCLLCGKGAANSAELKYHMLDHTDERPHCCDVCGLTFKLHSTFQRHRERHDNTPDI